MNKRIGLIKTSLDAHTMGINSIASLLKECGCYVSISPREIEESLDALLLDKIQLNIIEWIKENKFTNIGISYRLDPDTGVKLIRKFVDLLETNKLYGDSNSLVKKIHFAGLTPACDQIDKLFKGQIITFRGGESPEESLLMLGIPKDKIPKNILEGCKYDKDLLEFGEKIIKDKKYKSLEPLKRKKYSEFGTFSDSLELRLDNNFEGGFQPLMRAHSGPYSDKKSREECISEYIEWCKTLSNAGYLDVLSIGSSQLSQSNFGEDWAGKTNGGGVPVNSEKEYQDIWKAAQPMLVRTYSGTKNIEKMAEIYDKNINNAWHALSLWWFDELDGRGPNPLYVNLKEHINTIKQVAKAGKPVETNVPHHFAFRGCDDITYVLSAFLAAKTAKICGVKTFVLQNMLNTPRSTWGVKDLVKSRVMLKLVKELEDDNFRVILQTRAGLDYLKPDIEQAKVQLAAVTALMDDIDPHNVYSPEIIHVVSYSEALYLATPEIINESIQITRTALTEYRKVKNLGLTYNVENSEILEETEIMETSLRKIINAMENNIQNLYSPEGLYIAFVAGWLPVPELWSNSNEFIYAKKWNTAIINGGVQLVEDNKPISINSRISKCTNNITKAIEILKSKYNVEY